MHEETLPYLRETLLFLGLAGILVPLLQRFRVNQVLGFLAVGALVGPFGLGLWSGQFHWLEYVTFMRADGVAVLGNLGVLFLMFTIGLELSAERLWALRRWVFGAGAAQVAVSAVVIGTIAYLFGNRIEAAIIFGLVLSLSSTAVVMQLMADRRTVGSSLRQSAFSVLMLQDLAVVPILILIGVLANGSDGALLSLVGWTFIKSAGAIAIIYLAGRQLIRPLFRSFAKQPQPEVFMALVLLSSLGIAAATAAAGLSMALGAFLAGLLLAETEFRHEVEVTIEPFKGLLMGLFFMSVGMQTDVREVAASPIWLPLSVVGLFAIKASVIAGIFRAGGFNWGRALEGGLLLGQGGEFAFIVVGYAMTASLIDQAVGQFIMLVVGLSLFATPFAARAGRTIREWWEERHPEPVGQLADADLHDMEGHVVIAGFGRVGQLLGDLLTSQDIRYVALENDARAVARLNALGYPVFFGDAARAELLHKVHADRAAALVLTMDHPASALHAVKGIRRTCPHLPLFARSRDEKHALELKRAGATLVIPEALESGLQLSNAVLQTLGVPDGMAAHVVQLERERRIANLRDVAQQ